ncbi:MAG TPA: CvpA family protein [bacterium]|jgi:membrane protein required for colicin V production
MNLLDGMLCALLIVLVLLGVLKGLVKIGAALGGLALAVLFAGRLSPVVAQMFAANGLPEGVAAVVAYGVVFLAIILVAAVAAWLVTRGLEAADVGWLNRLLGGVAGLAMGLVAGSGVILGWTALTGPESPSLRHSALAPAVVRGNDWLLATTPEAVKQRFREQRQRLEARWQERPAKP